MRSGLTTLKLFIRLSRPLFLLGAVILYALGAGIAHFLGASIDWSIYLIGQIWVTLIQLSTHYLNEYFDSPADADNPNRTIFTGGSGALGPGKLPREVALWSAIACLTVAASLTVLLTRITHPDPVLVTFMALIFLGSFFYSTPPIRLSSSGYGELTTSIIVANLVPGLAFLLQYGELHRLWAMATFPLTPLHIAMMLTFELPDYATDIKHSKLTLMVRAGWEKGMLLHNALILSAFLLVGLGAIFGLPLPIALPALLTLPLGVFQVWMMSRIAEGSKPNWKVLSFTAVALFSVTAYLLAFSFWTR